LQDRRGDGFTALTPIRDRSPDFADLLAIEPEADLFGALRSAESVGRPLGDDRFPAQASGARDPENLSNSGDHPGWTGFIEAIGR